MNVNQLTSSCEYYSQNGPLQRKYIGSRAKTGTRKHQQENSFHLNYNNYFPPCFQLFRNLEAAKFKIDTRLHDTLTEPGKTSWKFPYSQGRKHMTDWSRGNKNFEYSNWMVGGMPGKNTAKLEKLQLYVKTFWRIILITISSFFLRLS